MCNILFIHLVIDIHLGCSNILLSQFSRSVVSDSLWLHRLQHTRLFCPSPTPGVYSDSCPLSQWCHSTISSSVIPFSSCLQSFPTSGSFPMSQFFASDGQSIRALASASVFLVNIQDWFPLGLTLCVCILKYVSSRENLPPALPFSLPLILGHH